MAKTTKEQILKILEQAAKNADISDLKNESLPLSAKLLIKTMEPVTESILFLAGEIDKLKDIKKPS